MIVVLLLLLLLLPNFFIMFCKGFIHGIWLTFQGVRCNNITRIWRLEVIEVQLCNIFFPHLCFTFDFTLFLLLKTNNSYRHLFKSKVDHWSCLQPFGYDGILGNKKKSLCVVCNDWCFMSSILIHSRKQKIFQNICKFAQNASKIYQNINILIPIHHIITALKFVFFSDRHSKNRLYGHKRKLKEDKEKRPYRGYTQQIDRWLIDCRLINKVARHDGFVPSVFNIILRWCI